MPDCNYCRRPLEVGEPALELRTGDEQNAVTACAECLAHKHDTGIVEDVRIACESEWGGNRGDDD